MVAGWMLSPDAAAADLEFEALLAFYKVPVPPGKRLLHHGTAPVGSGEGTGPNVNAESVRDHFVFAEALADAVLKKLAIARLEKAFHHQVFLALLQSVCALAGRLITVSSAGNAAHPGAGGDGCSRHRLPD